MTSSPRTRAYFFAAPLLFRPAPIDKHKVSTNKDGISMRSTSFIFYNRSYEKAEIPRTENFPEKNIRPPCPCRGDGAFQLCPAQAGARGVRPLLRRSFGRLRSLSCGRGIPFVLARFLLLGRRPFVRGAGCFSHTRLRALPPFCAARGLRTHYLRRTLPASVYLSVSAFGIRGLSRHARTAKDGARGIPSRALYAVRGRAERSPFSRIPLPSVFGQNRRNLFDVRVCGTGTVRGASRARIRRNRALVYALCRRPLKKRLRPARGDRPIPSPRDRNE